MLLLGKELYDPQWSDSDRWSDFGGRFDASKDTCEEECASREFFEETAGCVFDRAEILEILKQRKYAARLEMHSRSGNSRYVCFLVRVQHCFYSEAFWRARKFLNYIGAHAPCIEKVAIRWISFNDLTLRRRDDRVASFSGKSTAANNEYSRYYKLRHSFRTLIQYMINNEEIVRLFKEMSQRRFIARAPALARGRGRVYSSAGALEPSAECVDNNCTPPANADMDGDAETSNREAAGGEHRHEDTPLNIVFRVR